MERYLLVYRIWTGLWGLGFVAWLPAAYLNRQISALIMGISIIAMGIAALFYWRLNKALHGKAIDRLNAVKLPLVWGIVLSVGYACAWLVGATLFYLSTGSPNLFIAGGVVVALFLLAKRIRPHVERMPASKKGDLVAFIPVRYHIALDIVAIISAAMTITIFALPLSLIFHVAPGLQIGSILRKVPFQLFLVAVIINALGLLWGTARLGRSATLRRIKERLRPLRPVGSALKVLYIGLLGGLLLLFSVILYAGK